MLRLALALVPLVLATCGASSSRFEPILEPTAEYAELQLLADRWKRAVSSKATDELASYALLESREVVERALSDKGSTLYEALYGTRAQHLLQKAGVKTLLIPHEDLVEHGMGTTVCFFDPMQQAPSWPISREELRELSRELGVLCIFTFRADQQWYVSYEFAVSTRPGTSGACRKAEAP